MKVAVFIKSSAASGGLETQNRLLVEGLRRRSHQVEVVETKSPFGDRAEGAGDVDVVISQSAAGTRFLLGRKGQKPPVVVIQHGTLGGSLKTRMRMDGLSLRLISYAIRAYILDQLRLRRCEAIIAVSRQVKRALSREYFLDPGKISVVCNGIEVEKFVNRKSLIVNRRTVLYLGRLAKEKGLNVLLQAFQETIQQSNNLTIQLLLVGSGPEFGHLNSRTQELELSDVVEFVGKVPYAETPKYYQQADVFVLPSIADEGLPMTILEAMAAGLPVVASRIGGIPEAVVDGETGVLVEPGNVSELSTALAKLLTDGMLREEMGGRARKIAKEKFSQETMVRRTLEVLEEVSQ